MKRLHLFLIAIFSFVFSFIKVRSFDLFYYLKVAEIESILSPIKINLFSYSFPDFPYKNYSFIFSEFANFFSDVFGLPFLTIVQCIVVALSFILLAKCVYRKTNIFLLLSVLLLSIFTLRYRLLFRPHNLSYLFFAINVFLLIKRPKFFRFLLFLNQLFWVNTNNSFILGIVNLLLLYPYNRQLRIGLPKTFIALVLGSLVNQHFYLPFMEVLNPFWGDTKNIFDYIKVSEWQPTDSRLYFSFYGMLILVSAYLLIAEKKWLLVSFYLFYLLLSIRFVRFIDYFAFVGFWVTITGYRGLVKPGEEKLSLFKVSVFVVILIFCVKDYLYNPIIPYGYGEASYFYPKGAVDYLKKKKIQGKIFNSYAFGGYIIKYLYPDCKPVIDGRLCYPIDFIKLYANSHKNRDAFLKIIENFTPDIFFIDFDHPELALYITELKKNYALVYFDDNAMIFLDRNRYPEVANKDELESLKPVYVSGYGQEEKNVEMVKIELEKVLRENPSNRGFVMYSNILLNEGKKSDAEAILKKVVNNDNPNGKQEAYNNLGVIKLSEGKIEQAESFFKETLFFNSDFPTAHFNLAQIYDHKGRYLYAFYHYKKFIKLSEINATNDIIERVQWLKRYLIIFVIRLIVGVIAICGILYIILRKKFKITSQRR